MLDDADIALIEISLDALPEPGQSLIAQLIEHIRDLEQEVIDAKADAEQACENIRNECEEEVDDFRKERDKLADQLSEVRSDLKQAEDDLITVTFKCDELTRARDKLIAILKGDEIDDGF